MAANRYHTCLSCHSCLRTYTQCHASTEARYALVKSTKSSSQLHCTELGCCSACQAKQLFIKYTLCKPPDMNLQKNPSLPLYCAICMQVHMSELLAKGSMFRKVRVLQASSKPDTAADSSSGSKASATASRSLPAEAHHRLFHLACCTLLSLMMQTSGTHACIMVRAPVACMHSLCSVLPSD